MYRLLFVTKYIDHILYFFLEQLSQRTELTIVVDQENEWTTALASSGTTLLQLAPRSKLDRRFGRAVEALSTNPWDLVQSFHGNDQLANLIRWNKQRFPLVAYRARIGHLKFRENPAAYWNVRNPSLAAVAAVSTQVKNYLETFRFLKAQNVRVLHHGINRHWAESMASQRFDLRSKLGVDETALIVASVAALRPVKRFDYIVHAAEQLKERAIHFAHVGHPRGWEVKAAHLPNVHFLGQLANPFPILAEADLFAMTSHNEAFGRANLEAMAVGKPVIGSNTGGLLDLVDPGVTGQLFETESRDDFARLVAAYDDDRDQVRQHGRNAIERVDRLFSTDRMTASYLELYDDVLARTGKPID
jgi:glycosyltransferase involved in cell wall biosynthesis